ncbi:hypothetical protein ES703_95493 [subsurface metagenome]
MIVVVHSAAVFGRVPTESAVCDHRIARPVVHPTAADKVAASCRVSAECAVGNRQAAFFVAHPAAAGVVVAEC